MSDQLTDRARKAAEEIAKLCFDTTIDPCEIVQGGCIDGNGSCENHVSSVFAAIIDRHVREIIVPYQKTIECAAYKLACSVSPQCPGDTGDMSCSDDECERDTDSIAECWVKCFSNMIAEKIHEEAAPCLKK